MSISYIEATESEREFFIHVHHTSYRDTIEAMFGWDERLQDQHANRAFDEGGMNIIWNNNKRVGVIGWEDRDDHVWLKELFLLPEYQGQGIGSKIIKDTITKARSLAKDVRLRTLKANMRAKELYERHGFVVTEATDIHWNMILPFTMPEFKTERLLLKPVTLKDVEAYQRHFSDYEIIRFLGKGVPWPYPENGVKDYLSNMIFPYQGSSKWAWGLFKKELSNELIGVVALWKEGNPGNRWFWLSREHQGKGLMTEAIKPVMDYAFKDLGFKSLLFSSAVGNEKSRRIKEKTGARFIRTEPMEFVDPEFKEHEIWELTAEEWLKNGN